MSTTTNIRPDLFKAYKYVVNNWAVGTGEVASHLGADVKEAAALLKRLQRVGLIVGEHVNGEPAVTWQSYHDIQNENGVPARSTRDFNAKFPKGEVVSAGRTGGNGSTGPRYTEEQLKDAEARRAKGESFKVIGAALGIKATAYLSKVLKRREVERQLAAKAKPTRTAAAKAKPTRKRFSKAQALVDSGLANNLADARAQLRDMSE